MSSKPVNLAIADDHTLFRKTLISFLSEQKNIHVSIQASDAYDLSTKLRGSSVDVLLMDLFMPELTGPIAMKIIREEYPDIKILGLSMSTDLALISDILDLGVYGFVSKGDEPEELLRAITAASDGCLYRNRWLIEALYWNKQKNIHTYAPKYAVSLNDREKKILQMIWEEKSNKQIADELFLGVRAVEKIRHYMKEKVGASSIVGLLKYAISREIVRSSITTARAWSGL